MGSAPPPGEGGGTGSRGIGWAAAEAEAQTDVAHSSTSKEGTRLELRVREALWEVKRLEGARLQGLRAQ